MCVRDGPETFGYRMGNLNGKGRRTELLSDG